MYRFIVGLGQLFRWYLQQMLALPNEINQTILEKTLYWLLDEASMTKYIFFK